MLVAVYRALYKIKGIKNHITSTMAQRTHVMVMTKYLAPDFKANQSIISVIFVYVPNDGTKIIITFNIYKYFTNVQNRYNTIAFNSYLKI